MKRRRTEEPLLELDAGTSSAEQVSTISSMQDQITQKLRSVGVTENRRVMKASVLETFRSFFAKKSFPQQPAMAERKRR